MNGRKRWKEVEPRRAVPRSLGRETNHNNNNDDDSNSRSRNNDRNNNGSRSSSVQGPVFVSVSLLFFLVNNPNYNDTLVIFEAFMMCPKRDTCGYKLATLCVSRRLTSRNAGLLLFISKLNVHLNFIPSSLSLSVSFSFSQFQLASLHSPPLSVAVTPYPDSATVA